MTDAKTEEHLLQLKRKLTRQLEQGDETSILSLLDGMGRVYVTEDILRTTKIGVFIGKLRKHNSEQIAERAHTVVTKWRRMVKREEASQAPATAAATKNNAGRPTLSVQTKPTANSTTGPMQRSASSASGGSSAPTSPGAALRERTITSDEVTYTKTGSPIRNKMIEMFYSALAKESTADAERIITKAVAVEEALLNQFGTPGDKYRARARELYLNLKRQDNHTLRSAVVSGDLRPERLCTMTSEEMMSEEQKQAERRINEENIFKARGAGKPEAATDAFKCPRCKQRKCTYFQMQTRSADEPMTTFVTCVVCDNRWKFC